VPELVPRELVPDSVSLNAASNNLARAVGPALGGQMVAAFKRTDTGSAYVFLLNSVSFAAVIWVLFNWKRIPLFKSTLPSERIAASIRSGLRYVRYAPNLQASLLRVFTFCFFFSAIWSLLAVVARNDLHQGALGYGILNGSLGIGAVAAALTLPRLRHRFSTDRIIAAATFYTAFTLIVLARIHRPALIIPALVVAGYSWTSSMASLNTSVQISVPDWVQARALGAYMMTFQGGLALGSVVWGLIAERASTPISLLCAAAGFAATYPLVRRFRILKGGVPDTTPSGSAPRPNSRRSSKPSQSLARTKRPPTPRSPAPFASPSTTRSRWRTTPSSHARSTNCAASACVTARCAGVSTATPLTPNCSTRPSSWRAGWTTCARASATPPPTSASASRCGRCTAEARGRASATSSTRARSPTPHRLR
jgi:MFS family permease